jgi:hypothetical protein
MRELTATINYSAPRMLVDVCDLKRRLKIQFELHYKDARGFDEICDDAIYLADQLFSNVRGLDVSIDFKIRSIKDWGGRDA